jgi:DNA-binding transcriptional MerR regulator
VEFTTRWLYVGTLKKKPGALATSSALQQASPKLKNKSTTLTIPLTRKEFIELLHFMQSGVTLKEIESSINQLRNIHPSHVTTEKIKLLCAKQKEEQTPVLTYSSQKQLILNTIQKTLTNVRSDVSNKIHSLRRRSMIQSKQMWVEKD